MKNEIDPNYKWLGVSAVIKENSALFFDLKKINNYLVRELSAGMAYSDHLKPHLNFYDLSVPTGNVEKIKIALDEILVSQPKIECQISEMKSFSFGLLYVEIKNNPDLDRLQKKILAAVEPFKGDRLDPDYEKRISQLNQKQVESLKKYGNPYVTDFKPHITLGFLPDKKNSMGQIIDKISFMLSVEKFTVDSIDLVAESSRKTSLILEWNLI